MNEANAIDLIQSAIWTVIVVSGPCVAAAMLVGVAVAVLQALTQIQEATLTFVPKIMAVFVMAMFSAYFMGASLYAFANSAFSHIETGF
jgi:flagellar biosynthesis protein FliQ